MRNLPNELKFDFVKIDHIAIAVVSIEKSKQIYALLGGREGHLETVAEQGVDVLPIYFSGTSIELLQPISEATPVGRFLQKRGEGLHHIALQVDDIAKSIANCIEGGIRPIDLTPRNGAEGKLIAFLDPRTTGGVLIELTQVVSDN